MNEDRNFPLLTLLLCILGCSDACFLLGIKNRNYFLNIYVIFVSILTSIILKPVSLFFGKVKKLYISAKLHPTPLT